MVSDDSLPAVRSYGLPYPPTDIHPEDFDCGICQNGTPSKIDMAYPRQSYTKCIHLYL